LQILDNIRELALFYLAIDSKLRACEVGNVLGEFDYTILDYAYFSFVNYNFLGYGYLVPTGYIRFMAGTESLADLVLIAWSASFTYLEMQRIVKNKK
jgi:hypothetical protein